MFDGTLLPCWSWASHPQLYSGKHKKTGMNVQVGADLHGTLAWISDPIDGSRHDSHCLTVSGALDGLDPRDSMADKGYLGSGMITRSGNRLTASCWAGRRSSTPRSTGFAA
nr:MULTISPECIES: transposase family protein [unclassified Nocardia]